MDKYNKLKLENQLCFPLYALSREVIKLYKPYLDKFNLTYTQYITMLAMWEEEKIIFKELGKKLHLDSGTLTPVLKKLESMDFIVKYRTKEDDRIVIVELTDKGRELKDQVLDIPEKMYCGVEMSKDEIVQLKYYLEKMLKKF
ncbi:MarR family winged helix-turn-helix transcriptional regulator [Clostridium nigeriense]|uniref:MarR family winged helix-turn-helix transcriptional regulator n=1 Tax=Clostridium nigeriense TaxID=1805470 RepID=UPI003D335DAE